MKKVSKLERFARDVIKADKKAKAEILRGLKIEKQELKEQDKELDEMEDMLCEMIKDWKIEDENEAEIDKLAAQIEASKI